MVLWRQEEILEGFLEEVAAEISMVWGKVA